MNFTYPITKQENNKTIDRFLRDMGYSRRLIIDLKTTEHGILVNGTPRFTNYKLSSGEELTITLPEEESSKHIVPIPLPFDIVYEDEHILAINKPADMPIHPSINNHENTLANAAAWYFEEQGIPFVYRCINRLDRDTSGLVLLAKHALSGCILSEMVKKRILKRTYMAACEGTITENGTVDLPIGRFPDSVIMRCIDIEHGDHAVTHYEPIVSENNMTLLKIQLETGRTHQIRIHMGAIGHPLPGDYLYNPNYEKIKRQPLHSSCLTFPHPITGKMLHLEAAVPDDMKQLFPFFSRKACKADFLILE